MNNLSGFANEPIQQIASVKIERKIQLWLSTLNLLAIDNENVYHGIDRNDDDDFGWLLREIPAQGM